MGRLARLDGDADLAERSKDDIERYAAAIALERAEFDIFDAREAHRIMVFHPVAAVVYQLRAAPAGRHQPTTRLAVWKTRTR